MPKIKIDNEFDVVKLHLERLWKEVFWRRENEQKITVWCIGLFGILLTLVYNSDFPNDNCHKILISIFPLLLGIVGSIYLYINWKKTVDIARIIVKINEGIGCWENNYLVDEGTLFPKKWKNWGQDCFKQDKVSFMYFVILIFSALVTIIGIILR